MTYQTLYRKYRSNDLNELIGQQHIIKTLTNAIAHNRLSHAYIFSGPRGTGKTSTARILAKMVNQTNSDMVLCEICQKITQGSCVDVIEIDAASHTGVDYMRQLIEQVQFLPVEAKYKVFIIDEVHMLSTCAFNALLKTLEEPPEQVLFILATTELHKIPATIQSRAQTLHFRLLDSSVMKDHLAKVCSLEGYTIDSQALEKVVNIANGGMRDGLSLLDQLMSVSEDKAINVSDVSMVLGTVDDDQIISFLNKCFSSDSTACKDLMAMFESGVDVFQLYDDVIHYLHYHFLVNQTHPFNVSDGIVSSWLKWFCDQLPYLKMANDPSISAQVALFSILTAPRATVTQSIEVPMTKAVPVQSQTKQISTSQSAKVQQVVKQQSSSQVSSSPKPVTPQSELQSTKSDSSVVSASTASTKSPLSKDAIDSEILEKAGRQFPVLKPVLAGAKLLQRGETLCLILEETYQFFEKKLSELKFKEFFIANYNQSKSVNLTEWYVSTDINVVYQDVSDHSAHSVNKPTENSNNQVKSKTVNQIIEMFEGQIIQ